MLFAGKDVSGHEVSERGKLLQSVWGWVQELVGFVNSAWPELTMPLQWCATMFIAFPVMNILIILIKLFSIDNV